MINTLISQTNFLSSTTKDFVAFLMLRKFYFVFGKVNVDFFLKDKNAAFEVVFYFSSLND